LLLDFESQYHHDYLYERADNNPREMGSDDSPVNPRERADRDVAELLADATRGRRRALHLTQEDLADLSGVSLRFIHDLESAKPTLQLVKVVEVLSTLGLHLDVARGASRRIEVAAPDRPRHRPVNEAESG